MNQLTYWLKNVFLRRILTVFVMGMVLAFSDALGWGTLFQAQAEPLTPEATKYEVNSQDSPFRADAQDKVNKLFEENKQPQTASDTTKKIGENLTKIQKTLKQKIEGVADKGREKTQDAYNTMN